MLFYAFVLTALLFLLIGFISCVVLSAYLDKRRADKLQQQSLEDRNDEHTLSVAGLFGPQLRSIDL